MQRARVTILAALAVCSTVAVVGCQRNADIGVLTAQTPLHLEEHLDAATIVGSEVPVDLPESVEWRFDEPQPDWRPAEPIPEQMEAVRADDALRLSLSAGNRTGAMYVALPDRKLEDWGYVEIRARTRDAMRRVGLAFNHIEEGTSPGGRFPFYSFGDRADLVTDGTVRTYRLSLDDSRMRKWEGSWTHLGIWFNSQNDEDARTLDILSISLMPTEADYADAPVGVSAATRRDRRIVYGHAPGRLEYRVRVPEAGRLDLGLGVLRGDAPMTFEVTATADGGELHKLLEETHDDPKSWAQRSVDLSHLAGQTVTLALGAVAQRPGTVALWAAPTLSGTRTTDKPNVILYIIDGGAADYMSVYGYNRRTTPNLDRIAALGAVFERAYSNASWSQPSTQSFMTSLQHSVLGGGEDYPNTIPEQAVTMAQRLHSTGYQTGAFIANPWAGKMSGLDRGVDVLSEGREENNSTSSVGLHDRFWRWRDAYPGQPYWVHFQTTDVHWPWRPVAPFAGLFTSAELREDYYAWEQRVRPIGGRWPGENAFEETGVDRVAYDVARRGLYDENMAHNDYQIGRLVDRLEASGEWENTLLIVAADHSHYHAGLGLLDPVAPRWTPYLGSFISHVPLIVVWPGGLGPGQRFNQPVSMIDVLPTVVELAGLPAPEVMQGQSLAPLLLGTEGWEPRPVIIDEFGGIRENGEPRGFIEVIDGRWGASLQLSPPPEGGNERRRPAPLLVCDLWSDPHCLNSLHEERPDLVKEYTEFLEAQFEAHQMLGSQFTEGAEVALTPTQLRTLRALGYIQ